MVVDDLIKMVRAVNEAENRYQHTLAEERLFGFYEGLRAAGFSSDTIGSLIMAADTYYIHQGIERPMCGGVFLDWAESIATQGEKP